MRDALRRDPARIRTLLGSVYLVATLVAGLAHVHDCCAAMDVLAGCDDPGAHWAAHREAPDLTGGHDHLCSLCQGRADHQPWSTASPERPRALGQVESEAPAGASPRGNRTSHPTRGPPRLG